ncbi:MAG: galactokinase [Henriciella sp.]
MTGLPPKTRALSAFEDHFGGAPSLLVRAPGRVNLIGEHTDYNDGFVLPCAIDVHTLIAARPNGSSSCRVIAADLEAKQDIFDLGKTPSKSETQPWANYVRGVFDEAQKAGWQVQGMDIVIAGNIPHGAGLSSSASLEVGIAKTIDLAFGKGQRDHQTLALLAQKAENNFVGAQCGIMDQLASSCGQAGHALLIDCRSLALSPISLPPETSVLIVHSGIKHSHVDGAYNRRRADCELAAKTLGVTALRDVDMDQLEQVQASLDPIAYRRARHVISENARTLSAAEALKNGDMIALGQLMAASHASMRDDFEITTPEIDKLVAILQTAIGDRGGARMTGGGFGGCVVAILPEAETRTICQHVEQAYFKGGDGLILSGRPMSGVHTVSPEKSG